MNPRTLRPFTNETAPDGVSVTANVSRQANVLAVHFLLIDPQSLVMIPPRATIPTRRDNLWQETCFELFCSPKDSRAYWEFNLAPSGDWNVYRFDAYRQGMREEKALADLPFSIEPSAHPFELRIQIDLSPVVRTEQIIDLGVTAVIKTKHGNISYWALAHRGAHPDFHLRESFALSF